MAVRSYIDNVFDFNFNLALVVLSQFHLFTEEVMTMDHKSLDKQGKEHFQFYNNFMLATKISIVVIVATLVIMAATLL